MRSLGMISLVTGLILVCCGGSGFCAEPPSPAPNFKEVYDLIQAHLAGVNEAELNRTAVQALLSGLGSRVSLEGAGGQAASARTAPVTRASLFDGGMAYVRVGRVSEGLAAALGKALERLGATNKLSGVVLDLRYSGGRDYAAAAAAAELFQAKAKPLLDWGNGVVISKETASAVTAPVAVLVNRQTAAGAEALAAVLRETGSGLILGSRTAGQATVGQEYPLSNGQRLRIVTGAVRLGDGTSLPMDGLKPDIEVEVSAQAERAYYGDAFKTLGSTNLARTNTPAGSNGVSATNRAPRRARFGEAELVRERREGLDLEEDVSGGQEEAEGPVVQDPVLSRALDLLKGLAVVRSARP